MRALTPIHCGYRPFVHWTLQHSLSIFFVLFKSVCTRFGFFSSAPFSHSAIVIFCRCFFSTEFQFNEYICNGQYSLSLLLLLWLLVAAQTNQNDHTTKNSVNEWKCTSTFFLLLFFGLSNKNKKQKYIVYSIHIHIH